MHTIINRAGASKKALSKWIHLLDREDLTVIHTESHGVPWLLIRDEAEAAMYVGEKYIKHNVRDIHPANAAALNTLRYRAADVTGHTVATFGMYAFIVEVSGVAMLESDICELAKVVSRITGSNVDTIQVDASQEGELRVTHGKNKIFHRSVDNSWWHLTDARRSARERIYLDCLIELKG